ncbi:hypothetical protein F8M41_004114 [Gigaspora margarita]|uniref:Uncharacterized protein n=1 Tax=Gigaspora margarita TaxID=4874 RepID=A0A8H4ERV5_GIGMA|nr:hypothetical protein F8M41_004114 [Gigaspora margarita]
MQQQGLNGFFNALTLIADSSPSESQVHDDNEITIQAENSTKIYGDFMLASDYESFDMVKEFSTTDLPESPRNALIEFDQNVEKESDTDLKNKPKGPKQMEGQINKENKGQQSQMNKEALEKFLTGNVFHNCTFNFG